MVRLKSNLSCLPFSSWSNSLFLSNRARFLMYKAYWPRWWISSSCNRHRAFRIFPSQTQISCTISMTKAGARFWSIKFSTCRSKSWATSSLPFIDWIRRASWAFLMTWPVKFWSMNLLFAPYKLFFNNSGKNQTRPWLRRFWARTEKKIRKMFPNLWFSNQILQSKVMCKKIWRRLVRKLI